MADTKISNLNELTYISGGYVLPFVDPVADETKKIQWANLLLASDDIIPAARVYNSGAQSINDATYTDLTFDSERFDTDTIHDTGSNTNRLTCKTAGKYLISGTAYWDSNSTNDRFYGIHLNNTSWIALTSYPASGSIDGNTVATVYDLAVNDYVTFRVRQTSGGALNIASDGNTTPEFMMIRIGD